MAGWTARIVLFSLEAQAVIQVIVCRYIAKPHPGSAVCGVGLTCQVDLVSPGVDKATVALAVGASSGWFYRSSVIPKEFASILIFKVEPTKSIFTTSSNGERGQ